MEELGDARLRCDQLMRYLDEAVQLIEKSDKKDHFFEVAGHLIQGIPETAFKLEKALQAVALAADRIDYEEIKQELRPEKVEELERVLKDVRIRPVKHRSENPMKPTQAAARLREFAKVTREEGSLPLHDVAAFISDLGRTRQASASPVADTLDRMASVLESGETVSRQQLATILYRMAGEAEVETALRLASQPKLTQEHMQLGNADEVKKKFKAENPNITDEALNEIAEQWEKNKDVVKDKTALESGDAGMPAHFEAIRNHAIAASRAASAFRWRPALMGLYYIVDEIGTVLVALGSMDTQKSEGLKREIRQQLPQAAHNIEEMAPMSVLAAEADISKLYHEMTAHLDTFDMAWSRYEKDPEKNRAKLDDALKYMKAIQTLSGILIRNLEKASDKTANTADEARRSRFEQGVPADPTQKMDPEDAEMWKEKNDEHKDKFKTALGDAVVAGKSKGALGPDGGGALAKFEEGKPADPTENMSPEDAKRWKEEHDKNQDNFKSAYDRRASDDGGFEDGVDKGKFTIILHQPSASKWTATYINPQGGSGSSSATSSPKVALQVALGKIDFKGQKTVKVLTKKLQGEEWATTKTETVSTDDK
jgi:hypothetical protein